MNKSIFKSKTFWVQIVTVASALFPPVQAWFVANPVGVLGALAAVNTLVRFATKGGVKLISDDGDKGSTGGFAPLLFLMCTAVVLGGILPSCTTVTSPDGTVTKAPDQVTIEKSAGFAHWLYGVFTTERARLEDEDAAEEVRVIEVTK